MLTGPLIDFYVGHGSKISHLGSLFANKCLMKRCRLNLDMPRLDSFFLRKCMSVSIKMLTKSIDGLVELHDEIFADFPRVK